MNRIPEPELMNSPDQARAYAEADFSEPHNLFIEKFMECFPKDDVKGNVLDLGCGPADISIRFARVYPVCKILGIDGAHQMLMHGNNAIKKAGLSSRIELLYGRIPEIDLPEKSYFTIISNSLLHHLHRPESLWSCIKRYSRTNSKIFIMDLLRPGSQKIARQLVDLYALDEPEILRQDFFNSLCAAFTPEELSEQLEAAGLLKLQIEVISDRHMAIFGKI